MKRVGICAITLLLCFCSLLLVGCGDKEFNPGGNTPGGGSSQKSEISFEYNDIGMQVGDERTIKVVISEDVTDKNYSITSYNSSIVTASKTTTGVKLIAKSTGTATITLSSIYGTDTLTVKVNSKTISLTASNVSSYLRVTTTKVGASVTVNISPVKYNYDLDFSATIQVTLLVTYNYYKNGVSGNPSLGYGSASRSVFLSDSQMSTTIDMTSSIRSACPGNVMVSYNISSVNASISTIIGSVEIS